MDRLVSGLKRNRFLVVGRVGMDTYPYPPGTAIEAAEMLKVDIGGSAANMAVGLVRLGGEAALVTRVSDDAVGRYCVGKLRSYGVSVEHVRPVSGPLASQRRNSLALYEIRVDDHQSVIYRNGAADFEMDDSDVEGIEFGAFGAVIAAGTVLAAEPSRSATLLLFERARAAGIPVIFDIDYRPYSWPSAEVASAVLTHAAGLADAVIGNEEEFGFMAGHIEAGLARARALAGSTAALVIYKMGHRGALTLAGGSEFRSGIYPVTALKPTGAGDSFMAGLLASLAAGHDLERSVLRGSACASIVVSKPGCAPAMPDRAELETFLATHPGPQPVD